MLSSRIFVGFCLFFTIFSGVLASPMNYYVSTDGADSNPGTISQPFQTIQKAADVAVAGDVVNIRGGLYRETVKPTSSGVEGSEIVFQAYNGEKVVLSGCELVSGWQKHQGDIWKAANSWDLGRDGQGNTLFVDGQLKFEARQGAEKEPIRLANWGTIPSGKAKSTYFIAPDLKGWGDDFWNGAKVRSHRNDWTIETSTIADYESATGKVTFTRSIGGMSQKHHVGYYIYDTIKALDKPGEWYKDRKAGVLYYQAEPGQNPNDLKIEFKKRPYAFDLCSLDYIQIKGMVFRGAGIQVDGNTDYNVYDSNRFYAFDKGRYGNLSMSGKHNTFSSNEISQTWGSAISISGFANNLINNYIHDIGYYGTSRVVGMDGANHFVSYNTVSKIARSFLDGYPMRTEFAYNIFEDGGNLSWDTGFFDGDSGRGNGGGCIVHHNVFRNSQPNGIYCSFYAGLDLTVHHNIIYDISPFSMRLGQLQFLNYYHNTIVGPSPRGNVNAKGVAYQSSYQNNLQISTDTCSSIGVGNRGNYNYKPSDFVDYARRDLRLAKGSGAIDAGIVLPGVNDGYKGQSPDAGAIEYDTEMWKVGHDFANPPKATYSWRPLPGTNMFDNGQFRRPLSGWTNIKTPQWFNGNTWNTLSTGLSALSNSVQFNPGDGMSRIFKDVKPNTWYTVATETRLADELIEMVNYSDAKGEIKKGSHRGEKYVGGVTEGQWLRFDNVEFGHTGKYNRIELTYTRPYNSSLGSKPNFIELRLDSPEGELLGSFDYNITQHDSWYVSHIDIRDLSGSQTLYFLPKGPDSSVFWFTSIRFLNSDMKTSEKLKMTVRGIDNPDVTTWIGECMWRRHYEEFAFKTGPKANQAELVIINDGPYDAYLDKLALYEKDNQATNATSLDKITKSTKQWKIDLGEVLPIYGIRVVSPTPGSDIHIAVSDKDSSASADIVWQQNYATNTENQTILVKACERSTDGNTELEDVDGRFVYVQSLGDLSVEDVQVFVFDEQDLVFSDAIVEDSDARWQATFPQIVNIGQLTLYKASNMDNFKVSIWDRSPADGGRKLWEKSYRGQTQKRFSITGDEIGRDRQTRLASVLGRTVIVEARDGGELSLSKVTIHDSVFVKPLNNLALYGKATQIGNLYTDHGHAEDAINGLALPQGEFTSTPPISKPWWQVELSQDAEIDQIVVYNRKDSADRLGEFRVSMWDGNPDAGGKELWGKNYSFRNGDIPAGGSLVINGNETADGNRLRQFDNVKFVRIQLLGYNILSLPEVQVWKRPRN